MERDEDREKGERVKGKKVEREGREGTGSIEK
jgi:hypothetical protein